MSTRMYEAASKARLDREVERERHERELHDEQRAGLAVDEEFRNKDAREQRGAVNLRRPPGR
ncbi:hypothetical protein [Massilia aerilata]|uniref:Uncharacterized protein n=1 Tax=Massilia aerilata TaxID=453817 RepID=A0ABW0S1N5_9BURK